MKSAMQRREKKSLRFESLEDRVALAGDVTAAMSASGDLLIKGDVSENHIAIFSDGAGHIVVQGSDNTNIKANGNVGAQATFDANALRNVTINMGNAKTVQGDVRGKFGADVVSITGIDLDGKLSIFGAHGGVVTVDGTSVKGSTSINFGNGVSSINGSAAVGSVVSLGATTANNLGVGGRATTDVTVDTGGSNDEISIAANAVGRNLNVRAHAGNDAISLGGAGTLNVGGKLSVDAGAGDDTVVGANLDVTGKTSVEAGAGLDTVTLGSAQANVNTTFHSNADVQLGGGTQDSLIVQGTMSSLTLPAAGVSAAASANTTFAGNLSVTGGAGADAIGFNGAVVDGNLNVNAGAGADAVLAANLAVLGNASVSAGAGDDIVAMSAVAAAFQTLVNGSTSIDLGAGVDTLSLAGTVLNGNVKLNGSAGADTMGLALSTLNGNVAINGGANANTLAFDAATVQLDANATMKTSSAVQLGGAALAQALLDVSAEVQASATTQAFHNLFV